MDKITIRLAQSNEAQTCENIMRSLSTWFGIEHAIVDYRKAVEKMETYVAVDSDSVIGFITINQHNPYSAEIHVMAVRSEFHRRGVGRSLIQHAQSLLRNRNIEYLQVKTLGPSRLCEHYAQTRQFYDSLGFRPLEETNIWGETNPCLIMIQKL